MLFQKFYNWIKYKTLPSSFLFKNRLFIERNSQYYNILSNFGNVFRASKWSTFSQINIKKNFKFNFYFFIFSLFLIFYYLIFYTQAYQHSFLFNNVSFLFWFNVDIVDYYFSFLVWFVYFFSSFLLNNLYSYFFFTNFSNQNIQNNDANSQFIFSNTKNNFFNEKVSKLDLNWVFYAWLNNSKETLNFKNNFIKPLFNSTSIEKKWYEDYDLFSKLYKLIYFTKISTDTELRALPVNAKFATIFSEKLRNDLIPDANLVKLNLYYFFSSQSLTTKLTKNDEYFFFKLNNWTSLFEINPNFLFLTKMKNNEFFNNIQIFYTFFKSNLLFKNALSHNLNLIKNNRWLYKYFILNRKIFKNSNKITHLKSLTTNNLVNSTFFNRNIWNNFFFNNENNFNKLVLTNFFSFNNEIDSNLDFMSAKNSFSKNMNQNLENSYFWFVKRVYFLNNLSNNNFVLFFKTILQSNQINSQQLSKTSVFHNFLCDKSYFNSLYFFFNKSNVRFKNLTLLQNSQIENFTNLNKDFNFLFSSNEFFKNYDNKFFLMLTNFELIANQHNIFSFNTFSENSIVNIKKNTFFINKAKLSNKRVNTNKLFFKFYFTSNISIFSENYKKDLILFINNFKK